MSDWLLPIYPWLKAGHIVSFTAWMAALFYLPRLFVYHVEAARPDPETSALFRTMERRLLKAIMTPAMIATWIFGLAMISAGTIDWSTGWPWVKALAVLCLTGFHGWCAKERRSLAQDRFPRSGRTYRALNEVPTLLLLIVVVAVIVRPF